VKGVQCGELVVNWLLEQWGKTVHAAIPTLKSVFEKEIAVKE